MTEENKKEEVKAPAEEKVAEKVEEKIEKAEEKKEEKAATKVEVPAKFKKMVEEIESMTVIELFELVKILEEKFGVSAAAMAAPAANGGGDGGGDEPSTVSVELTDCGASKVAVIKVIKEVLSLGLKEAKDLVDGAPANVKSDIQKAEAEEIKEKIEAAGGKVNIK